MPASRSFMGNFSSSPLVKQPITNFANVYLSQIRISDNGYPVITTHSLKTFISFRGVHLSLTISVIILYHRHCYYKMFLIN